jgi:hypothetical protein
MQVTDRIDITLKMYKHFQEAEETPWHILTGCLAKLDLRLK